MLKQFDGSIAQSPEVDNLIAELGPKVAKTAATVVFSDGSLCSFVVDGDLFQAQNHIATYFLASEIKRVTFKAITRRDDVVTCPDCQIDIPADGHCWYCENNPVEAVTR